ncbi:unnamed protein product, partial [Cylicocyclus nassatus]
MNCSTWNNLLKNPGFLMVMNSHIAASVLSIIISAFVIVKCGQLSFHANCRVYQAGNYVTLQRPCEFVISRDVCFTLRFLGNFCMISFAILQFAMVAERYVALWKRSNYETFGRKLGFSFAFVSVSTGLAFVAWTIRVEDYSYLPYCTGLSPRNLERITILCYLLCSINVITLVGVAALFTVNHIAVKSRRFDLGSSYQLAENYSVIRLLLPLSIFQNICYAFFTFSIVVLA